MSPAPKSRRRTPELFLNRELSLLYRLPAFPFAALTVRFGELFTRTRIRLNRPIDAVGAIAPRPLLLIHDAEDRLIPVADAHALYAAAGEPKELWIVPELPHAYTFIDRPDEYVRRLDAFFTRALQAAPEAAAPAELAAN